MFTVRLPPLEYLFGMFLLHAVTANGWHYPTGSRMQAGSFSVSRSCTRSRTAKVLCVFLRLARREGERHAVRYTFGFPSRKKRGRAKRW